MDLKYFQPIVLCAGLGTRLRPLSNYVPKPAAPLGNQPIAFSTIRQFLDFGFEKVHCNTHYLADFVEAEIRAAAKAFGYNEDRIVFWRERELLNTGGGIQRMWLDGKKLQGDGVSPDAIVVSGDISAKLNLSFLIKSWLVRSDDTSSLMVTKFLTEPRSDVAWVGKGTDGNESVVGFGKDCSASENVDARLFTTQQIIGADLLANATVEKISSIDLYYRAGLKSGRKILNLAFEDAVSRWFDIGNYADYAQAISSEVPYRNLPDQIFVWDPKNEIDETNQDVMNTQATQKRINILRSYPELRTGESFLDKAKKLVTEESRDLKKLFSQTVWKHISQSALIFEFDAQERLGLECPLLIPLESLEGQGQYSELSPSQTYFVFR